MSPGERLELIDVIDVDAASVGTLASGFTNIKMLRGYLDSKEAALARRQDLLASTDGAAPATDAITRASKTSRRSAENAVRRAGALADAPTLDAMLQNGDVSSEHADALASETSKLDELAKSKLLDIESELASAAASKTPRQFRKHLRHLIAEQSNDDGIDTSEHQRTLASITLNMNDDTGMGEIRGALHPDDWQRVNRRLDAEITALTKLDSHTGLRRDQLRAIALFSLVTGNQANSLPPAQVVIHVGLDSINGVAGAPRYGTYSDGATVPAATVRRHACDAEIIPVVLDGDGMPLDVGRGQRLATKTQRIALRTMYSTCAVDGCDCNFDRCEIHHVLEWTEHQGLTDLEFLLPVCGYHHHRFHEGRWQLQLDPSTRQLTIHYPDGTLHSVSSPDLLPQAA